MSYGPNPWHQQNWDWRAATNFMAGGAGSGLIVAAALARGDAWLFAAGALLVGVGLLAVWAEIGRPLRALNVFVHVRRSWMSREAWVAPLLFAAVGGVLLGVAAAGPLSALLALAFVYCQARILQAAKGIPAWREPATVPLVVATGLAEGAGLWLLLTSPFAPAPSWAWAAFAALLAARLALWSVWRRRVRVAPRALAAIDRATLVFKPATLLPLAAAVAALGAPLGDGAVQALQALAGVLAAAGGAWFKFTLVTHAAFNQGFLPLPRLPVRGVRRT